MKVKVCPECGKHNSESAWSCDDCGTTLSMKTLIDTEDIQSEGQQVLSEISSHFKQDVENVLETDIQSHETVVYGCNITELGSMHFGYLLITSHRLICVKFSSETKRSATRTGVSLLSGVLTSAVREISGANVDSRRPILKVFPSEISRNPLIAVDYPKTPLTSQEDDSRFAIIHDLKDLVSANIEEIGYTEPRLTRLNAKFEGDKKLTVTFYAPHHFEKVKKLLLPWLREKSKEN